jgi:hypothetical protein
VIRLLLLPSYKLLLDTCCLKNIPVYNKSIKNVGERMDKKATGVPKKIPPKELKKPIKSDES